MHGDRPCRRRYPKPQPMTEPAMTHALAPGSIVGILGGGQLGRMLSVAASRLGLRCHIFEPGAAPPAGHVCEFVTTASYDDEAALRAFGESVDVMTYEFENVPTAALDLLESLAPIRPGRNALATSQDRLTEKRFLESIGLTIAPFATVDSLADLEAGVGTVGLPAILKTRRFGYDGKGQARLTNEHQLADAFAALNAAPAVLEGFVDFDLEISVIAARSMTGAVACFDPGHNVHVDGILRTTTIPAPVDESVAANAVEVASTILEALDYVGVIGVELFVTANGLVVNEIAPRVHNSGHWTQNGCAVDQFEQHIRAVAGWSLGDPSRQHDVVMENVIGDEIDSIAARVQEAGVAVHAYGKAETKPGRKMGHINRIL